MRCRPWVAAAAAAVTLTGCGGGPAVDATTEAAAEDASQASPEAVLTAFYERVADADWNGACALVDASWLAEMRGNCPVWLSSEFDAHRRERLAAEGVRVDPAKIEVAGTVATLTGQALNVSFGDDDIMQDTALMQVDGAWVLTYEG